LQLSLEAQRMAHSHYIRERSVLLPNIDSHVTQQNQTVNLRAQGLRFQPNPAFVFPTRVGPFYVFDARVELNLRLLDLSALRRVQASHRDVDVAVAGTGRMREQTAAKVAKAYAAAQQADAEVETAKADVSLAEALLDVAKHREKAEEGTEIETTRASVKVSRNQQRLLAAESARTKAHLDLIYETNLDWNTILRLTDILEAATAESLTQEEAVGMALRSRADFKEAQVRTESARLNLSAAKLERLPSLEGHADYGGIDGVESHMVAASLRIPLFDGGRMEADRTETMSALRQAILNERDARNLIELQVRQALATMASSQQQVQVAEQGLKLADDELAQARRRYEAGVTSSVEVNDAETRVESARDDRIAALFSLTQARIDLAQAMGTIETITF
jgi:outer membrane protein TolC